VGQQVEILSGVAEGEEVAITALSKIKNGTPVEVVK
jgi:hypothetical protein